jgi:hypothetical protein
MSGIFRRLRRSSPSPHSEEEGARQARDSRVTAQNAARREASEGAARGHAADNETRRQASDAKARRQAVENEARRQASDANARRQAAENEARRKLADSEAQRQAAEKGIGHRSGDGAPDGASGNPRDSGRSSGNRDDAL